MSNKYDLRNKPFMTVTYFFKPNDFVKTEKAGWFEDNDKIKAEELVEFFDRVPNKKLHNASIVIDILGRQIVKNRYGYNEDDLYKIYMERYKDRVEKACREFFSKNPEKLRKYKHDDDNKEQETA